MPPIHHRDPWPTQLKKHFYLVLFFFQVCPPVFFWVFLLLCLCEALRNCPVSSKTQRVFAPWSRQFTNCIHREVEGRSVRNSFLDINKSVHGSWRSTRYATRKITQGTQLQWEAVTNEKKCVNSNDESRKDYRTIFPKMYLWCANGFISLKSLIMQKRLVINSDVALLFCSFCRAISAFTRKQYLRFRFTAQLRLIIRLTAGSTQGLYAFMRFILVWKTMFSPRPLK